MSTMTAAEVAEELGVSKTTAYKLMREMGRVRVGRVVRVKREAFDAWVAAHTEPAAGVSRRSKRSNDDQLTLGFSDRSRGEAATRPR